MIIGANLLIAGTEDYKLRFIDLSSNKVIKTVVGHADAISCLSSLSPNLIMSGGHDGSVRTWDLRTFQLLNDMSAHRRKYDEGTLAIAHCNSLIATGGADSIVKVIKNLSSS